jgi:GTP pyrophosphokinase/guanosine-3',5'-bis(diphosphate) 3'-pyrophosphohydrolase
MELLFNFGIGRMKIESYVEKYLENIKKDTEVINIDEMITENQKKSKISNNQQGIVIDGTDNTLIRFAKCCSPLPGDEVFGYVTRGTGIAIHKADCPNFLSLKASEEARVLEVKWDSKVVIKNSNKYGYNFTITMLDRPNALMDVIRIISDAKINILGVNSNSYMENGDKLATMKLGIEISDKEQVNRLKNSLYKLDGIIRIK